MSKINFSKSFKSGFTLIELLVVIAIIGILASIVLASLNSARSKGGDAAVKTNLANARGQAEVFYNTNTVVPNTYTDVCTNGTVGGALGIGAQVLAAARASGLNAYNIDGVPSAASTSLASCNDGAGAAWAAEVPLKAQGANQMWCVDSTGKSRQTSTTIGATTVCP